MKTIMIRVKGKVQGVYFRQSTRETALRLGISGEVNNEPDGSVKVIATGTDEKLQQLITWCHRGPSAARVDAVDVQEIGAKGFEGFVVKRNE